MLHLSAWLNDQKYWDSESQFVQVDGNSNLVIGFDWTSEIIHSK